MKIKVRTSYHHYRTQKLLSTAKFVSTSMRKSPTFQGEWIGCPTNINQLDAAIADLDQTDLASRNNRSMIPARLVHEEALKGQLSTISHYVSMVSNGNEQILRESGFPLITVTPKTSSALNIPPVVELLLKHGGLPGLLIAICSRAPGNCSYRLSVCTGEPTIEANWTEVTVTGKCRIEVPNCEPGKKYFFRVQVISPNGTRGHWSQIVSIIAL